MDVHHLALHSAALLRRRLRIVLERLFFLRLNSLCSLSFFSAIARTFLFPPSLFLSLSLFLLLDGKPSTMNPKVSGEPGLEMLRLWAHTHRRLRRENEIHLVLQREYSPNSCFLEMSTFRFVGECFRYESPIAFVRFYEPCNGLCVLIVTGLINKIALCITRVRFVILRWRHTIVISDICTKEMVRWRVSGT